MRELVFFFCVIVVCVFEKILDYVFVQKNQRHGARQINVSKRR